MLVPSFYFEDRFGMKKTILLGSTFMTIGSIMRCGGLYSFWWILAGNIFGSFSLPFITNPITKVSAVWFEEDKVSLK